MVWKKEKSKLVQSSSFVSPIICKNLTEAELINPFYSGKLS